MTAHVLQCVAVCCSVLQCVAVCCSVLQCVAVCCRVLPCVAVCCRVLQCVHVAHEQHIAAHCGWGGVTESAATAATALQLCH